MSLSLQAMTDDELAGSAEIVRKVLPAPGEGGELPTRDGRAMCVPDPVGLASPTNAAGGGRPDRLRPPSE